MATVEETIINGEKLTIIYVVHSIVHCVPTCVNKNFFSTNCTMKDIKMRLKNLTKTQFYHFGCFVNFSAEIAIFLSVSK